MTDLSARFARVLWPATLVGGLLLVAFALVPWGTTDEGVRPAVTGLGRVSVPGARPEDVAFLEEHTERPALVTLALGAVIVVAAAIGWWRPTILQWVVVAVAALGTVIWTAIVLGDVAGHLFDSRVTEALGDDLPTMTPGYGVVGSLVVAVVLIGMMGGAVAVGRHSLSPGAS
ncbi:hypothetical protein AAFP30_22920 [Gordonia sp. CPCC 205515]|uniref:hypothetical protein n=1 Tax=Gordonia sp. CPCC 205515 TaxID=3140791 RepID=UPI003AF36CE6